MSEDQETKKLSYAIAKIGAIATIIAAIIIGLGNPIVAKLTDVFFPTPTWAANPVIIDGPVAQNPNAQGKLIYSENFYSGTANDWIMKGEGVWSTWQKDGNWVFGVQNQPDNIIPNAFLEKSNLWTNYIIETEAMFQSGSLEQLYIITRTRGGDDCTGYIFGGNRYGINIRRLDPRDTCRDTMLANLDAYPLVSNRLYKFRIDVIGNQIRCYIDNKLVFDVIDSTYPIGGISFQAYAVKWGYFDNINIYQVNK